MDGCVDGGIDDMDMDGCIDGWKENDTGAVRLWRSDLGRVLATQDSTEQEQTKTHRKERNWKRIAKHGNRKNEKLKSETKWRDGCIDGWKEENTGVVRLCRSDLGRVLAMQDSTEQELTKTHRNERN